MIEKLEEVKEKILRGTTTDADIDIINTVKEYIEALENQAATLPEPALLEVGEEIGTCHVIIEQANIYINKEK